MNSIWYALKRVLAAIAIGVITFFPTWGIVPLSITHFPEHPIWISVGLLLWVLIITLILPLNVRLFRTVTTVIFIALEGVIIWQSHQAGLFNALTLNTVAVWLPISVFAIFGWLMIASPIWRSVHGAAPVDNQSAPEHGHHN